MGYGRALFITTTNIVGLPLLQFLPLQSADYHHYFYNYLIYIHVSPLVLEPVVERRPPATAEYKAAKEEEEKVTR